MVVVAGLLLSNDRNNSSSVAILCKHLLNYGQYHAALCYAGRRTRKKQAGYSTQRTHRLNKRVATIYNVTFRLLAIA
jgi:hypothetical protein